MMYIYDYNLQFFSPRNYLFGQNFKILIQTYRTLFKFSLLNAQTEHNIISALLGPPLSKLSLAGLPRLSER